MTSVDALQQQLGAARDGVRASADSCVHAESELRDRADAFAQLGLEGVASLLIAAQESMERAAALLTSASATVDTASAALSGVTDKSKTSEITAAVGGVITTLGEAGASIAQAETEAEQAVGFSAETEVEHAVEVCTLASSTIQEAHSGVDTAQSAATEYQAQLQAAAKAAALGATPPQAPPRPPALGGFSHRRPHPGAAEALRRFGRPTNGAGRISARGHLYDMDGRRIDGVDVMKPHRKGKAPPCDDLREPWRSDPDHTTTWHAERDAAKVMRDDDIRESVLYLNIPTCGKESQDPKRCHANLEKILPAGSVLWVWSVEDGKSPTRRRYEGNGEAIT
ncbi:DddA-like double-stranded DNA deaminase toxin [Stackebrandtia soli]|uniref:DddA-like double-stranded DNA deaminase toxin n=1 Tax=Stackebrandtia soli TaxID=1892856 RepID=UPI0039ED0ECE